MLRIWGRANSSNVQKPLWLCAELGIEFERFDAGGRFGKTREPEYLAMNPNALVPTIDDGGFILWESNTIIRYLASRHGADAWYPQELKTRARIEQWMDWSSTALAPAMHAGFWGLIRTPENERDAAAILASAAKTGALLAMLDRELAGSEFVCGSEPTLADICVGIHTYRWFGMRWDSVGFTRPDLVNLARWYAKLTERPAYRDVVMIAIT